MLTGNVYHFKEGFTSSPSEYVTVGEERLFTQILIDQGDWATLASVEIYREWKESGEAPIGFTDYSIIPNPEVEDDFDVIAKHIAGTQEDWDADKRAQHERDVLAQIPEALVSELVNDPLIERDIVQASAAANQKLLELETADLDTFDPTLPSAPEGDTSYSTLTAEYTKQEPYVGTPQNVYGPEVHLHVVSGEDDPGTTARANVNIAGVLLPSLVFEVTEDPAIFKLSFPSDRLVAETDAHIEISLLWASGSAQVGRTLILDALDDRESGSVKAGEW